MARAVCSESYKGYVPPYESPIVSGNSTKRSHLCQAFFSYFCGPAFMDFGFLVDFGASALCGIRRGAPIDDVFVNLVKTAMDVSAQLLRVAVGVREQRGMRVMDFHIENHHDIAACHDSGADLLSAQSQATRGVELLWGHM